MASYPALPKHKTYPKFISQVTSVMMEDGSSRGQIWDAFQGVEFRIVHIGISESDLVVLDAFYEANYNVTNTIIYDGDSYSFRFDGGYDVKDLSSTMMTAEVKLKAWK